MRKVIMKKSELPKGYDAGRLPRVRHRNIVRIFAAYDEGENIVLEERQLKGRNLLRYIQRRKKKLSRNRIKKITKDICRAAAYLHDFKETRIIHGDIKPENIMILPMGRAVLIDFCSAAMGTDSEEEGLIWGTYPYAAPELKAGVRSSPARDVYGIGMTMVFMLRGEEFTKSSDIEKALLEEPFRKDTGLLEIAYGCIRQDPGLRFSSAKEVLKAVKKA